MNGPRAAPALSATGLADFPAARPVDLPGGRQLALHEQPGAGPPLLLIHGFTDCAKSFRLLLPRLAGRHVLMPDLRGHGGSFRADAVRLEDFADDLADLLVHLRLAQVVAVGHSMGALVALTLAAQQPQRLAGLALIAASLRPRGPALLGLAAQVRALPEPLAPQHRFFDAWHHSEPALPAAFRLDLATSAAAMRRQDWLGCLATLNTADLRQSAAQITLPCRLISGGRDPIFPPDHHAALARALPHAACHGFATLGHNPHWERPDLIAPLLSVWEGVGPQPRIATT